MARIFIQIAKFGYALVPAFPTQWNYHSSMRANFKLINWIVEQHFQSSLTEANLGKLYLGIASLPFLAHA